MIRKLAMVAAVAGCSLAGESLALDSDPESWKVSPWLESRLADGEQTEFLVLLNESGRPSPDQRISRDDLYRRLTASARASQKPVLEELAARGIQARGFYLVNAVLVQGDADLARSLAARSEVARDRKSVV